jgi:hypothetical protein
MRDTSLSPHEAALQSAQIVENEIVPRVQQSSLHWSKTQGKRHMFILSAGVGETLIRLIPSISNCIILAVHGIKDSKHNPYTITIPPYVKPKDFNFAKMSRKESSWQLYESKTLLGYFRGALTSGVNVNFSHGIRHFLHTDGVVNAFGRLPISLHNGSTSPRKYLEEI